MDGGVRRGTDVMKTLAMGAHVVMTGRPFLYGVCAAGEIGARRAIEILQDELERSMRLCGVRNIESIRSSLLSV
jgi:isopentenyl diphosphate isomerase/L-lactate dehydrogenase-like FMN-dependent dehydrogenase